MAGKDFSEKQAAAWVEQELSKHLDEPSMRARMESETRFQQQMRDIGMETKFPRSFAAHGTLADALKDRLELLDSPGGPKF